MQIKTDKITNILGILGAILIIQQTYWPEVLPREYVAPILACIVSTFGIASNKRKIIISFNGHERNEVNELEDKIESKWKELEELMEEYKETKHRSDKNEH